MWLPDMPALRQAEMVSTVRDLGPSVPTIFVIAGKKLYLFVCFFTRSMVRKEEKKRVRSEGGIR